MSVVTAVLILGARKLHPLFPGVLLAVIVGVVVSMLGWYHAPTVNSIPSSLPTLTLSQIPWGAMPKLVLSGVLIALIGFTEAASIARRFASEDRVRWSADREFISQGVANIAASLTGGMPCGGSFSRSSVNRLAGAKTRASGAMTGLFVLAFLPFAWVLEPLPQAVLGAIVVVSVVNLMRFGPLMRIWRVSVPQALIAWGTFVATLVLAPRLDLAVMIGVGLSLAVFLWRMLHLEVDVHAEGTTIVFAPRGVLWFATAQRLDDALVEALAAHQDADALDIHLSRLGRIDTTGALVLRSVLDHARAVGLRADVSGVPPQSAALVGRILEPATDPLI
jgi:SulP family sulfate permease